MPQSALTEMNMNTFIFYYKQRSKTSPDFLPQYSDSKEKCTKDDSLGNSSWLTNSAPVIYNYLSLVIIGLLTWCLLWNLCGEDWAWDGKWFRLLVVAAAAWSCGQVVEASTSLPPLLGALLTGIIARNIGFLDMNDHTRLDTTLRKIYPVVILGKASLGWELTFMKCNWRRVAALGTLPWLAEVVTMALCAHIYIGFPIIWGFLLGTIHASVSCAVVMPSVVSITNSLGCQRDWKQLVCTAGGVDTALSVGVYGALFSFMFYDTNETYRYSKAILTLFVGVALGAIVGVGAGIIPHSKDFYVTEIRIAMVVVGGLAVNALTSEFGWGGAGGVAVLVCNAVAARFWAKDGWKLNNNPASTAYRVTWSALEPILFAFSGTFFEHMPAVACQNKTKHGIDILVLIIWIDCSKLRLLVPGFSVLVACTFVRVMVTCLTCWDFTRSEKIFICCAWTPKAIVEAVLGPLAMDTLLALGKYDSPDMKYAVDMMRLLVLAMVITTPVGFLLTKHLGPRLLKEPKDCETAIRETQQER